MEYDPTRLLAIDSPVRWLVNERVLAEWHEPDTPHPRYLGTLSTNNRSANFTLVIGCAHSKAVIALHLPVRIRASSTSSRHKHLFIILPIDALTALCSDVHNVADIPDPTNAALGEAGLAHATQACLQQRVIQVKFRLKTAGHAIMPQVTIPAAPRGTPLHLLQSLRSLSSALSFDAYLRFNTYAQVELRRIDQMLRDSSLHPASIDPTRMFKGLGAVDIWDQYRIDSGPKPATPKVHPAEHTSASPPPYEPAPAVLVPASETGSPHRRPISRERADGNSQGSTQSSVSVVRETPSVQLSHGKRKASSPPAVSLSANARGPERSVLSAESNDDETPPATLLFGDLVQWLDWAWSYIPDIHETLRMQLLALGTAAHNGNIKRFGDLRAECSSRLMFLVAEGIEQGAIQPLQLRPPVRPRDFDSEITQLVRWMNGIYRAADIVVERELLRLVQAARAAAAASLDDVASVAQSVEPFEREKAYCAAHVCFWLGDGRDLRSRS